MPISDTISALLKLACSEDGANRLATANPLAPFRWHRSSKCLLPLGELLWHRRARLGATTVRIECVPQSADRKLQGQMLKSEFAVRPPRTWPAVRSAGARNSPAQQLENGRHCLELFRRRAIYVEPEEAICRKAVRELADLDLKTIKHGCLIGLQA